MSTPQSGGLQSLRGARCSVYPLRWRQESTRFFSQDFLAHLGHVRHAETLLDIPAAFYYLRTLASVPGRAAHSVHHAIVVSGPAGAFDRSVHSHAGRLGLVPRLAAQASLCASASNSALSRLLSRALLCPL